jgi:hypothetical protein
LGELWRRNGADHRETVVGFGNAGSVSKKWQNPAQRGPYWDSHRACWLEPLHVKFRCLAAVAQIDFRRMFSEVFLLQRLKQSCERWENLENILE